MNEFSCSKMILFILLYKNHQTTIRSLEILRLLIEAGADINFCPLDSESGRQVDIGRWSSEYTLEFTGTVLEEAMKTFKSSVQV